LRLRRRQARPFTLLVPEQVPAPLQPPGQLPVARIADEWWSTIFQSLPSLT
jgi:hypothetical protein